MSRVQSSASELSDGTLVKEVAPFLKSLRRMLDVESPRILRWTPDGHAFEIHDMGAMTSYILPKYFKHCKYASFQRQLNYFHFRKWTKSRAVVCTFSNQFFQRDHPALTWRITRKRALSPTKSALKMPLELLALAPPDGPCAKQCHPRVTVEVVRRFKGHRADDDAPLAWIDVLYPELDLDLLEIEAPVAIDRTLSASTLLSR